MEKIKKGINKARDFASHKIDTSKLQPGDHIYAYRQIGMYSHHGIFIGNNMVIHFTSTAKGKTKSPCQNCPSPINMHLGVVKTCLHCFLREGNPTKESEVVNTAEDSSRSVHKEHSVRLYYYEVSPSEFNFTKRGSSSTKTPKPPGEVVKIAEDFFSNKGKGGFEKYDLKTNNCEHFATFCKTGERFSAQAERKITRFFNFSSHQ